MAKSGNSKSTASSTTTVGGTAQAEAKTEKKKRDRKPRKAAFPAVEGVLFTDAVPEGFDFGTHRRINRKLFTDNKTYTLHRAAEAQWKADHYAAQVATLTKEAETANEKGGGAQGKVKKAKKLVDSLSSLLGDISELGLDTGDLDIASLQAALAKKEEAKA